MSVCFGYVGPVAALPLHALLFLISWILNSMYDCSLGCVLAARHAMLACVWMSSLLFAQTCLSWLLHCALMHMVHSCTMPLCTWRMVALCHMVDGCTMPLCIRRMLALCLDAHGAWLHFAIWRMVGSHGTHFQIHPIKVVLERYPLSTTCMCRNRQRCADADWQSLCVGVLCTVDVLCTDALVSCVLCAVWAPCF